MQGVFCREVESMEGKLIGEIRLEHGLTSYPVSFLVGLFTENIKRLIHRCCSEKDSNMRKMEAVEADNG